MRNSFNTEENQNITFTKENITFEAESQKNSCENDLNYHNNGFNYMENLYIHSIQLLPSRENTAASEIPSSHKTTTISKSVNFKEIDLNFKYKKDNSKKDKENRLNKNNINLKRVNSGNLYFNKKNDQDILSETKKEINLESINEIEILHRTVKSMEKEIQELKLQLESTMNTNDELKLTEQKLLWIIKQLEQEKNDKFLKEIEYYKKKTNDLELDLIEMDRNEEINLTNKSLDYYRTMIILVFEFFQKNKHLYIKRSSEHSTCPINDYTLEKLRKDLISLDNFINTNTSNTGKRSENNYYKEGCVINSYSCISKLNSHKEESKNFAENNETKRQVKLIERFEVLDNYFKNSDLNRTLLNFSLEDSYKALKGRLNKLEKNLEFSKIILTQEKNGRPNIKTDTDNKIIDNIYSKSVNSVRNKCSELKIVSFNKKMTEEKKKTEK